MLDEEKNADPRYAADLEAWHDILDAFATESDRAAVVLAAAKLDELLSELLQRVLCPSPGANDELLDQDKPLSSFSAKIHMAYRLGLFDGAFARALHLIRRIRNAFAHETADTSLAAGPHRDRIRELTALWEKRSELDQLAELLAQTRFKGRSSAAIELYAAAASLMARLQHLIRDIPRLVAPGSTNLTSRSHEAKEAAAAVEERSPVIAAPARLGPGQE